VQLSTVLDINFDKNKSLKHVLLPAILHQLPVSDSHFLSANHEISSSSSSMARNWQLLPTNMCAYILHFISHLIEKKILEIEDSTNFQTLQILWIP